jgi:hypothetical protein
MSRVTLFSSVREVENPVVMDLTTYLEKIRDGEWQDLVIQCRLIKDAKERNEFKRTKMPTVSMSGIFARRDDSSLITHSGYIAIDLDHVDNINHVRNELVKDVFVHSVFMSTSGDGLRVLFKIKSNKHLESFRGIQEHLFERYELNCDSNGSNVSKPYIVSWDPAMYYDFSGVKIIFAYFPKETTIKQIVDFAHTPKDFEDVLKQVVEKKVNICEEYQDWLKVAFAFCDEFGESGRQYFHEVSRASTKYNARATDKQYNYCLRRGKSGIEISTFYYLAKLAGVDIVSETTRIIVRTTKNGKKAGLNKQQIVDNLLKFQGISNADKVVEQVLAKKDEWVDDQDSKSILQQLEMFISANYSLRMNEVTGYLENGKIQQQPSELNSIFIAAKKLIPALDYQLMIRLLKSDFIPVFNPFFEFFGSDGVAVDLPEHTLEDTRVWNSPHIQALANCIINDTQTYTFFFLRKWMVGVISAMHKQHCPLLLALLGAQETGKTEFFRRLLPKELKVYYAESKLDKETDDELLMCENIIIMDDELSGKSKKDTLKLNAICSKQHFSLRRPYGDHNEKILRLAVLCGTSNYLEIIVDPTGNRRIIAIHVHDIDRVAYNKVNKRDLWVEAYNLYKAGFDWRIGRKEIPYLNKDKEKFETTVKERELIQKYFEPGEDDSLTTSDIIVEIERITNQRLLLTVVGTELVKLGYAKVSKRDESGAMTKRWSVRRINRPNIFT